MTLNSETLTAIERKISRGLKEKSAASSKIGILILSLLLSVTIFISAGLFIYYGMQVRTLRKKAKAIERTFMNIGQNQSEFKPMLGNLSMPVQLQTTPLGERSGLVLATKKIPIRGVAAPYNPSMIEWKDGYLLFFRYDIIKQDCPFDYYTHIGCCTLNTNFEQTEKEFTTIDTGSQFSEDPRALKIGEEIYLVFNDLQRSDNTSYYRTMHIGKINLEESKLEFSTDLDLQIKSIEKNWVPFERIENGKPEIYLEYFLNPQKIMKLPNPKENNLVHLPISGSSNFLRTFWPHPLGHPRGGSTAQLVDGQYLAFFHSSFEDTNKYPWYVMGAYTFEKDSPFRVTAISHYPILFEGIYDSPHMNTADWRKRVIFPGSFSEGIRNGRQVLYVCCGENDSSIKLIIMDKQILLKNLKKL
jgi:predicted GH43/DUF377 family glycosyl hydrolase